MRAVLVGLVAVLVFAVLAGGVIASDGGTRVIVGDEPVGPYRLYFITAPDPAHTGIVTYIARLTDGATGEKIRNAEVTVELTNAETGEVLTRNGTHLSEDAIDYVAHVTIEKAGTWNGVLRVNGPAGPIESKFLQEVTTQRSAFTLAALGLPFLVVLLGLGGYWVIRTRRQIQIAEED